MANVVFSVGMAVTPGPLDGEAADLLFVAAAVSGPLIALAWACAEVWRLAGRIALGVRRRFARFLIAFAGLLAAPVVVVIVQDWLLAAFA